MKTIGVIPARMGSSRFPGKPLATIHGIPMLGHVYFRSRMNPLLDAVYIATCDAEICRYAAEIGADCILTSPEHERASDRTAQAVSIIEARLSSPVAVVVMIQGDEPMLHPAMLDEALAPLRREPDVQVVNLMAPLDAECAADPNEIKVVVDRRGDALYFSRRPLPWRTDATLEAMKQVCVIPFRRRFLAQFAALEPTPLERAESIGSAWRERWSTAIGCGWCARRTVTFSVDTPADLARVAGLMRDDLLMPRYEEVRSWRA
jgi:3-deoxy-manno-octulosonate cytidylyltransferase (CMP-KDO synthetase)